MNFRNGSDDTIAFDTYFLVYYVLPKYSQKFLTLR